MRLCGSLRWKSFYGSRWDSREQMVADLVRGDAPYTCLRTCQAFGPDDDAAVPERCQPGRACFSASKREPRG